MRAPTRLTDLDGSGQGRNTSLDRFIIGRLLWDGQTSRHGSKQPAREETREEAEMAVQLASVLVPVRILETATV